MINSAIVSWTAFEPILPEMLLVCIGLVVIVLDLFAGKHREFLPWLTVLGRITVMGMVAGQQNASAFGGMIITDSYAVFFKVI